MAIWRYTEVAPDLTGFITQAQLDAGLDQAIIDAYNDVAAALGLGTLTAIPTNGSVTTAMLAVGFQLGAGAINGVLNILNIPAIPQSKVTSLITDLATLNSDITTSITTAYNNVATALGLGSLTAIPTNGSVTSASLSGLFALAQSQVTGLSTALTTASTNAINNITSALGLGTLTAVPTNGSVTNASLVGGFTLAQSAISNLLTDLGIQTAYTKAVRDAVANVNNASDIQIADRATYIGNLYGYAMTPASSSFTPGTGGQNAPFSGVFDIDFGYTWQFVTGNRIIKLPAQGIYMITGLANWSSNAVNAAHVTAIRAWAYNSSNVQIATVTPDIVMTYGGTQPDAASVQSLVDFSSYVATLPGFSYVGISLYCESVLAGAGRACNSARITITRLGDTT